MLPKSIAGQRQNTLMFQVQAVARTDSESVPEAALQEQCFVNECASSSYNLAHWFDIFKCQTEGR